MTKPSVLVCDDEENIRAAIRLILERDYTLTMAPDGETALRRLEEQPVDLVLLDIKLPQTDGLEVLKTIMARPQPPRVVMLTAYQSVELAQLTTQAGAVDYLTKPFERAALLAVVRRALAQPGGAR